MSIHGVIQCSSIHKPHMVWQHQYKQKAQRVVLRAWEYYKQPLLNRVATVLEKSLNFGFSLKSPWKWICPWKVLEFSGPSLKFQLVVLDFLFCVFWTESLNGYSKLRGTRANFPPKNFARFARSILQVKYFSSSSCSFIILEQWLSYPSFPKNTYRYLCILCVSMYQSVSKWAVSILIVT